MTQGNRMNSLHLPRKEQVAPLMFFGLRQSKPRLFPQNHCRQNFFAFLFPQSLHILSLRHDFYTDTRPEYVLNVQYCLSLQNQSQGLCGISPFKNNPPILGKRNSIELLCR